MKKKEVTPIRKARQTYETVHKEERNKQRMTWGTTIPRELGNEINAFLEQNNIPKISLIVAGYELLQERFDPNSKWNTENSGEYYEA